MATKQYFKRKTSSGYEIIYPYTDANAVAETNDRVFVTSAQKTALANLSNNYLAIKGGQMTGPLSFNDNTALPQKSLSYICGIDAFANGGQMGWQSKSEFLSGYALSSHNHDSSYSAIGHTHSNYATSSHVHRYIIKPVGSTDTMYLEMNDDKTVQMKYKTPNDELIKILAYTDHNHDSTYIKLAEADTAATANKIVKRDSNGHINGNYIKGNWLYTSGATEKALSSAKGVTVLGTDGYIYYRTLANLKSDLGVPTITLIENSDGTVSLTIS